MQSYKSISNDQNNNEIKHKIAFGLVKYVRFYGDGFSYFIYFLGIHIFSRTFIRGVPSYRFLFFQKKANANSKDLSIGKRCTLF